MSSKYRIWCDHDESDFHGWVTDEIDNKEVAQMRLEELYRDFDGLAVYEIKEV